VEKNKIPQAFVLFSSPWQRLSFFKDLPLPLITQLLTDAVLFPVKPREPIFQQDAAADAFGFVVEGLVRLSRRNVKNQRIVMDFVGPQGMIAGLLMAHPHAVYPVTAHAIAPSQFLKIPKPTYLRHWLHHPEVMGRMQNANFERMQAMQSTRELQKYPLEEKIAHILLKMLSPDEKLLTLTVSRTDLADMVGARPESVIRIFSAWEKEGLAQSNSEGAEMFREEDLRRKALL
jgi:CRP-like cAMP-binding protein